MKAVVSIIVIAIIYSINKPIGIALTVLALMTQAKTYIEKYGVTY